MDKGSATLHLTITINNNGIDNIKLVNIGSSCKTMYRNIRFLLISVHLILGDAKTLE